MDKVERVNSAQELFDGYAKSYDAALSSALAPSGESREFFAHGRVEWLRRCWVSLARVHDGCWTLAAEMDRRRRCAASSRR